MGSTRILSNYPYKPLKNVREVVGDAEWENVLLNGYGTTPKDISKQLLLKDQSGDELVLYLLDIRCPMFDITDPVFVKYYPRVVVIHCDLEKNNVFDLLAELGIGWAKLPYILFTMFFSCTDIWSFIGRTERSKELVRKKVITRKRNTTGTIPKNGNQPRLKLNDLIGAFNSTLDNALTSQGITVVHKHLPTEWAKRKLGTGLKDEQYRTYAMENYLKFACEEPLNAVLYGLGDLLISEAWEKKVVMINELLLESLGFNPDYTYENCPRSSGALVSLTFNKWLAFRYPELVVALNVLCVPPEAGLALYQGFRQQLTGWDFKNFNPSDGFKFYPSTPTNEKKNSDGVLINMEKPERNFRGKQLEDCISGMSGASIREFGRHTLSSACFNAVVQGGRCYNERSLTLIWYNVFDIDLNSCYGGALRDLLFPVGLPTVWIRTRDTKIMTLGEWLLLYEHDLIAGLWQIVVETPDGKRLSFIQDLINSKLNITMEKIRQSLEVGEDTFTYEDFEEPWVREIASAHISGDFVLLLNEIKNGIITHDNLKIIRAVATSAELKGWMGLSVVTASYYPKSQQLTTDELVKELCVNPGSIDRSGISTIDNRSRKWAGIPMSDFVGSFLETRKKTKKLKVTKGDEYDLKQEALKLFINTTYGCLAAPYFAMGNTILANNITAKARAGVWMLSKALGTAQSITDGGLYSNDSVRFLDLSKSRKDKPGFDTLADPVLLEKHRNIKIGKLHDFDGFYSKSVLYKKSGLFKELNTMNDDLDKTATNHINGFWANYGLELPFQIEHKHSNTCVKAITYGSSDYLLWKALTNDTLTYNGLPYVVKCRGAKAYNHPKKLWLLYLIGEITIPEYQAVSLRFRFSQLIGVGEWLMHDKPENKYNGFHTHDTMFHETSHTPSTNYAPIYTAQEFTDRESAFKRKVRDFHKTLEDKNCKTLYGVAKKLVNAETTQVLILKELKSHALKR